MKEVANTDISMAALARAARGIVAGALAGEFPADPVIGTDLSQAVSFIGSTVKRHGAQIQSTLADALAASGRYVVFTDLTLPFTKAAQGLLDARNSETNLMPIKLRADSEADRMLSLDLAVVDPEAGWAGVYEVKRGNGATESKKRAPTERTLLGARLVAASYLQQLGYEGIDKVTSAVIDYYGCSGFRKELTLSRGQLDDHFGVPVVATIEAMTAALRDALHAELPTLLRPFVTSMKTVDVPVPSPTRTGRFRNKDAVAMGDAAVERLLTARPMGPGPRRSEAVGIGSTPRTSTTPRHN
jgi:hypothetical protein